MLPVTTGLLAAMASRSRLRAGSMPPITSTTMSISGSETMPAASVQNTDGSMLRPRVLGGGAHRDAGDLQLDAGAGRHHGALLVEQGDERGAHMAAAEESYAEPVHPSKLQPARCGPGLGQPARPSPWNPGRMVAVEGV